MGQTKMSAENKGPTNPRNPVRNRSLPGILL